MIIKYSPERPTVKISQSMLDYAKSLEHKMQMNRTKESEVDTLSGLMGEFVFAEWWYDDWKKGNRYSNLVDNFGKPDFEGHIEIKSSVFPFSEKLHLPIRQDYAEKRCPPVYIFVCFNVSNRYKKLITADTQAIIVGWTDGKTAHEGKLAYMPGVKGFKCYLTPVPKLRPMNKLREEFSKQ